MINIKCNKAVLKNDLNDEENLSTSEYTFQQDSKIYYDQLNRMSEAFFKIKDFEIREKFIELINMSGEINS